MQLKTPIHSPREQVVTLRDGTLSRLRAPDAADRGQVLACFERLSQRSRRLRFFAAKQTLTDRELDFLTLTDGRDHIAVAALALDADGGEQRMLGMARCLRLAPGGDSAELAIAIADDAQGLGLGSALIEQLTETAAAQGIRRLELEVLADNHGMRGIAERLGAAADWLGDGSIRYTLTLEPSPRTAPAAPAADAEQADAAPAAAAPATAVLDLETVMSWMQRDWIDGTDRALDFSRWLADSVWQMAWASWSTAAGPRDRTESRAESNDIA
jgi:RimJ/RimL family protein N-acetyltransferase